MKAFGGFLSLLWNFLAFLPVFVLLLIFGIVKALIIAPIVFVVIAFGNSAVIIGLWPYHVVWTYYCVAMTKKFGALLKGVLFLSLPVPLLLWLIMGIIGSFFMGLGYGLFSPLMATFEAIAEGIQNKIVRCFMDGTWSSVLGGCTIVRDFTDVCLHSYLSVMDGLLESKPETPIEIKLSQIPGCALAGILGPLIDVPVMTILVIYKAPVMLFKGWKRLARDLIGREGPFLETVCVPFAGLSILLWPTVVALSASAGIISSFFLGCYAAIVAYQENSTKSGLLYIVSVISLFDEYTNDYLSLREGSCFPRPKYRKAAVPISPRLPLKHLPEQPESVRSKKPPIRTPSMKLMELKAMVIWENFFEACEHTGKRLIGVGAIGMADLESWQRSKHKIINIGIPAYVFLNCFLRSIKSGSIGFLMRDDVELTNVNRPEGRVFDWFFEPMSIMKEQLKAVNLQETEEAYLYKLTLYCGEAERIDTWKNGGVRPDDEIRRAQLEGLSRRLQGFGLTLSRLPTFHRRFHEVVKALLQEAQQGSKGNRNIDGIVEAV
ncbi:putative membrane protein At3g27390 isoform X1 [Tasmannia lanceolata]|uniref:putative membrane protein At3g27390 isoform X1 n=1 Tax=Tasmannia lanceolata TaxID=3420 RepID=UPI004062DB7D